MKRATYLILFTTVLIASCSDDSKTTEEDGLYFRGGMDSVTIVNDAGTLSFDGWYSLQDHEYVTYFEINNSGSSAYAYQEIVSNPFKASEKVMHAVVLDDDPNISSTTRAQTTLNFKDEVNLSVYHSSHRMLLDEDVAFLETYPNKITWFVLMEAWNKAVSGWDGSSAGSARWNLNLSKETTGTKLFWVAKGEFQQPAAKEGDEIWKYENRTFPVPYNKWFTLDFYIKRGDENNGKLVIKITPDGETTTVLFDITGSTIYPDHPEIHLYAWQPFKFYFDDVYLDWMKTQNKTLSCYYNDFKWYKN